MTDPQPLSPAPATSRLGGVQQWLRQPANQLLLLLVLLASFPLFLDLGRLSVQIWDEARVAVDSWEMAHGGNPLVTTYDGKPDHWYTKPPLLNWLVVIFYKLLGYNEWALRLPSALAAMGTVILVYWFAAFRLGRPLAGFFGGLVLVTAVGYIRLHGVRTGDYEGLLTLWVTIIWMAAFMYIEEGRPRDLYWLGAAVVLGVLTKSVQPLLGGPALVLYALLRGRLLWLLRQPRLYVVGALAAAAIASYYVAREHYDPGYWAAVRANELGGRFSEVQEGHSGPFSFYFDNIYQVEYGTWLWWLLPACLAWLQPVRRVRWGATLLLLFVMGWLLVISAAATKLSWYTVPIYPALALLTGLGLDYLYHDVLATYLPRLSARWQWPLRIGLVLLVFYFPFRSAIRDILSQRTEEPFATIDRDQALARYVRDNAREHGPLGEVQLLHRGGYSGPLDFYHRTLAEAGQGQAYKLFIGDFKQQLKPGTVVMVCDPAYRVRLDSVFKSTLVSQNEQCQTLLLEAR